MANSSTTQELTDFRAFLNDLLDGATPDARTSQQAYWDLLFPLLDINDVATGLQQLDDHAQASASAVSIATPAKPNGKTSLRTELLFTVIKAAYKAPA